MILVPSRKAVVFRLRDPGKILTVIPTAKKIVSGGVEYVAVKHGVDEVKVLRNLGFDVPAPIRHYYDWPGRFQPFFAQKEASAFLTAHNRAFNLSDLGTGKSLAGLWAYDYLRSVKQVHNVLVISPLSTLERTWADEVFNHFPHLSYSVLHGSREKRLKLLAQPADVYIINHDGVEIIADALKTRPDIDLIIVDEIAQCARNANTDRWRALNTVINKQVPRKAWGMTGTPIPNKPTDAWAQCRLLVPDMVPPYFGRFKEQVMKQINTFLWVPRPNATEVVKEAMQPSIRFSRDECVDLPPCMYETRQVELTPEQTKAYKEMLKRLHTEMENGQVTAVNEAVKVSKLVQIACGIVFGTNGEEITIPSHPRINVLKEIIDEAQGKVIVFVPFVSSVKMVAAELAKHYTVEFIYGDVSKTERDRILSAFQKRDDPKVLVAQPATLSHGLTLTAANTIVWYAPVTSNDIFQQANGRITRPGQKNSQFIIALEGTPTERRIYERLKNKQQMQGLLLDMVQDDRIVA
jgi:SNF2 family DNA or RNA helicase